LIPSTKFPETFLTVRRIKWDIIINVNTSSRKVMLFLLDFNQNCFYQQILKKS
jgi:hypothetical protein